MGSGGSGRVVQEEKAENASGTIILSRDSLSEFALIEL